MTLRDCAAYAESSEEFYVARDLIGSGQDASSTTV
jgi:hypothetical protein